MKCQTLESVMGNRVVGIEDSEQFSASVSYCLVVCTMFTTPFLFN